MHTQGHGDGESALIRCIRELKVPVVTGLILLTVWSAARAHRLDEQANALSLPPIDSLEYDQAYADDAGPAEPDRSISILPTAD